MEFENFARDPLTPAPKHSEFGVGSFIVSLINWLVLLVGLVWMVVLIVRDGDLNEKGAFITGLVIILIFLFSSFGALLGAIGMFQHERKKVFAYTGFALNLLPSCGLGVIAGQTMLGGVGINSVISYP